MLAWDDRLLWRWKHKDLDIALHLLIVSGLLDREEGSMMACRRLSLLVVTLASDSADFRAGM